MTTMDYEFVMATAKEAERQILWSIDKWAYMSWGIRQKVAAEYEGMATLALRVSGLRHKGWVYVSLNEGKDCYEVRLLNVARTKVKRTLEEVYCDNLGEVLDGLIEKDPTLPDDKYLDKAMRDSARKMGMEVIDSKKSSDNNSTNSINNQINSEDNTMRLNMNKNQKNETKNAAQQQVNNNKSEAVKQVDVIGLMNGLKKNGTAKLSDYATPIEDAQAEEVENVNVGEMTVDSIMPKMSAEPEEPVKMEGSEYTVKDDEGKDVTFESVAPAAIAKPEPVVIDEEVTAKPQVTLRRKVKQTYKSVALPAKNGGEWSKVYGFASEQEAQAMADRLPNSVRATWDYGENQEGRETKTRHYYLRFGVRYLDVAAELADALNQGDKVVVARVVAKAHGVYAGAVADGKAESAARQAAKGGAEKPRGIMPKAKTQERKPRGTMPATQPAASQGKTYTAADMEATIREAFGALAGVLKADAKQFEPLIAAAMKKAA